MSTADDYPYNGKVLLAAAISLSIVIAFVLLLHAYAKWLLSGRPVVVRDVSREPPPTQRRSSARLSSRASEARLSSVSRGLDAAIVSALPVFVYDKQGEEFECVVCLGAMEAGETGRLLPGCKHAFHADCIDLWFMSRSTCPICRAEVKVDALPGSEADGALTAGGDQEGMVLLDELAGGNADDEIMDSGGREALGMDEVLVSIPPSSAMEDQIIIKASEPSSSVSSIAASCGCSLKRMLSRS